MRKIFFVLLILIFNNNLKAEENIMILKLKDGDVEIKLFDDVIFTPISIWDFSYEINYIIKSNLTKGIYHISGKDKLTKFEFGMKLLSSLGYNTKNISAGKITNFPFRAKRKKDQL